MTSPRFEMPMEMYRECEALVEQIRPLLAGRNPAVQGAVAAELMATWIAGHAADIRNDIMEVGLRTVRELVPILADELWKGRVQ